MVSDANKSKRSAKPRKSKIRYARAGLNGAGAAGASALQGTPEDFKRFEAQLVERLSRRQTGRRDGRPLRFDRATLEAAWDDLDRAYELRWQDERSLAVKHARNFLERTGVAVEDLQTELKKRTIRRQIVDPVLRRRR
jgi:hypothetical protein